MGDFTLDQIADLPLDLLIGGKAVAASDGGRFDVVDPATGEVITTVADGTVDDAMAAVDAADAAADGWAATAPRERAEVLRRAFELMTRAGRRARPPDLAGERQGAGRRARRDGVRRGVLPVVRRGGGAGVGRADHGAVRARTGSWWSASRSASQCS